MGRHLDDRSGSAGGWSRAEASYVSTPEVIEREARAMAGRQLSAPGFWRRFTLWRLGTAAVIVALAVVLVLVDRATVAGAVRGVVLMLCALALFTGFDAWLVRHRLRRAHRVVTTAGCPPGTTVTATYTLDEMAFTLPTHRLVVATSTVTEAVHEGRLLLLTLDGGGTWIVPDELLGRDGLDVVRAALGNRLRAA